MWPLNTRATSELSDEESLHTEVVSLRRELEMKTEELSILEEELELFRGVVKNSVIEKQELFEQKEELGEVSNSLRQRVKQLESADHILSLHDQLQDAKEEIQAIREYNVELTDKSDHLERGLGFLHLLTRKDATRKRRAMFVWLKYTGHAVDKTADALSTFANPDHQPKFAAFIADRLVLWGARRGATISRAWHKWNQAVEAANFATTLIREPGPWTELESAIQGLAEDMSLLRRKEISDVQDGPSKCGSAD